jgi:hypothetical protein
MVNRQKGGVADRREEAPQQTIVINLTKDELLKHTDILKDFFSKNPGSSAVLLKVGASTIKTKTGIVWNENTKTLLENLLGQGKMDVV